jgi:MFS family permease
MDLVKQSKKQMYLSVVSSLVGNFGSSIFSFGLSLMLLQKTGLAISFVMGSVIGPIVGVLFTPIVGPVVDKYSRKKIIVISQLATITALALYVLQYIFISSSNILVPSLILITILKISDQFTGTAQQASKADRVLPEHLTELAGYTGTASNLSGVISSVLGALLFTVLPFPVFVGFEAATEIITLLITMSLNFHLVQHAVEPNIITHEKQDKGTFKEGVRYIRKQTTLFTFILLCMVLNFIGSAVSVGLPVMTMRSMKTSSIEYSFIESCFAIGLIIGGIVVAKTKEPKAPLDHAWKLTFADAVALVAMALVPLTVHNHIIATVSLCIIVLATSIVMAMLNAPIFVWMQKEIPNAMQGRVFSVLTAMASAITPIGIAFYGFIFDMKVNTPTVRDAAIFAISGIALAVVSYVSVKVTNLDLKHASISKDIEVFAE